MTPYILTLDCGTTASKVGLFDAAGSLVALATQEYQLQTPTALVAEVPAQLLWDAFVRGCRAVLASSDIDPRLIEAFSISAQGETFVLVDRDGAPLRSAISWMDSRAQDQAVTLSREFGEIVYGITGQVSIAPTWPAAKLLWIRENEPDIFGRIHKVLLIEDYLIWKLTGEYVSEGSQLSSTAYWNITSEAWWGDMLEAIGVSPRQLPAIGHTGDLVGVILPEVARELGLGNGVRVSLGGLDQACGAIGVGNVRPGIFSENTGAALAICATQDGAAPTFDPHRVMPVHYHAIPHRYMFHTFTSGGIVLRWFRDSFCHEEMRIAEQRQADAYDALTEMAATIDVGSEGLLALPHLQGAMAPEDNPLAKGVFCGFTLTHGKGHFVRSIMEAIAFTVRRNLEAVEAMGLKVDEIRVLGGGARSELWNQIKADATGKTLVRAGGQDAACLGAAIIAGTGAGLFKSIEDASDQMVSIDRTYVPDAARTAIYQRIYARYVELYDSLQGVFVSQGLPAG